MYISTCHWCHVMERESFEDEQVAKLLNERFVSIKVDREERPDIDSIYMLVCQMMTGHGGWPLNVFLTPEQVPFYAGTYFPKERRYGMPSFKEIIVYLHDQYYHDPDKVNGVVEQVRNALHTASNGNGKGELSDKAVENAYQYYVQSFDSTYGGFGEAPKFPIPHALMFLLRIAKFHKNQHALEMVTKTLDGLARGGIYDHIGFGFSRYSVDEKYLVPHFEKMLYDNALLTIAYTEAYQVTKQEKYKNIAEQIITYELRDMLHPDGGFYSAEDADSEGEEGKFYVWTPSEVKEVLGENLGSLFCEVYDISERGNFEGRSIPNLIKEDLESLYIKKGHTVDRDLESARKALFLYREKRVRPFRDDKILTAWNGLMIAALAKAGRVFKNKKYVTQAIETLSFMERKLIQDGRLMVRYRDGEVKHKGYIDDYAFLLWGILELYETTLNLTYLAKAKKLADQMMELFWDEATGGFFFSGEDQEKLLVRQKETSDGAIPSGNSVAVNQLIKLAKLTGDFTLEEKIEQLFQSFSQDLNEYPNSHSMMLQAVLLTRYPMKEVVILADNKTEEVSELVNVIQQNFHPEITLLVANDPDELVNIAPFARDYHAINGKPTIYVCENFQCNQPTNDVKQALQYLELL
ncbi:thioredoxin domain-containing protein [Caldibacillus lycopersici]|uniref:Thioredoxin domain-containing protein n=1 Tax=Perspicuibacillus lycopersici TaxID=1325689 RepID=A0AAE3IPD8_9BACI|nr:thioredoxin domain-containing protein [Perspicuibacillus lycopersici]MCU9611992.1 thioredoxin domain-containing protein [Perspicuibacillus lycopersici]